MYKRVAGISISGLMAITFVHVLDIPIRGFTPFVMLMLSVITIVSAFCGFCVEIILHKKIEQVKQEE